MAMGIEGALISVAGSLLKRPFEDFYGSCNAAVKKMASAWISAGAVDRIEQRIEELEKIRTIVSRQVSTLSEIYYPANVLYKKQLYSAHSIHEILPGKNILITGTAGQGKSVLMRYLAVQELKNGFRIPLFIELRRIDKATNFLDLLKLQLNLHSGVEHETLLFDLLKRGNVTFFLDGFDEVPREFALAVKEKLADLIVKHPKIKIIMSSRPGALCAHVQDLPKIVQVEIAELGVQDFKPFLEKIGTDQLVLQKLLAAITNSSTQVKDLLKTPLMLTLLVLTCGAKQKIPDTLPEFYDSLFRVLAIMHDETKPGYVREMVTKLSYAELEQLFECFSFVSREKFDKTSLNPSQFEESIKTASEYTNKSCTAEGFKSDVSETVCLMVREGLDTTFIHKSIQEYYTARFIKSLPDDETSRQAYDSINEMRLVMWAAELRFLEQIDSTRYLIFFRKPQIEKFLEKCNYNPSGRKKISRISLRKCLSYYQLLGIGKPAALGLSIAGMNNMESVLIWEIASEIHAAVMKFGLKNIEDAGNLAKYAKENLGLLSELERIFSEKIDNALEELRNISASEKMRKSALSNVLNRRR